MGSLTFPASIYMTIGLDSLLIYCVKRVIAGGEECTFERLVCECFTLFPQRFSFARYPQWPDAARINKTWLRCRTDKGLIVGSLQEGFRLTPSGERLAAKIEQVLRQHKVTGNIPQPGMSRSREEAVVRQIRATDAFARWLKDGPAFIISNSEFRALLNCTLETPRRVLRQNLLFYKAMAQALEDSEALRFLDVCASQQDPMLSRPMSDRRGTHGTSG
jgi:hypothetical protein